MEEYGVFLGPLAHLNAVIQRSRRSNSLGKLRWLLTAYNMFVEDVGGISSEVDVVRNIPPDIGNRVCYRCIIPVHTTIEDIGGVPTIQFGDFMTVFCNLYHIEVHVTFTGDTTFTSKTFCYGNEDSLAEFIASITMYH